MSSATAPDAFSAHAGQYTALRRRLVPVYDEFYGAAIDTLQRLGGDIQRVLDLGAGTGLLGAEVLKAFPQARIELLDGSEAMLREARERLGDSVAAVHVADMAQPLPEGPFDAIVSALAIHHLEHAGQRDLFQRIHERLCPGGVFVDAEQVIGPTPELTDAYEAWWVQRCREAGATEQELAETEERMRHDRCADVGSLLGWLSEAGFAHPDCIYKSRRFAVVAARKGAL